MIPDGLKCCLGQRMVLIRPDKKKCDPKFLLYSLQSPYVQHQIGWNEGTGSTVSNIRIPYIKAFKIPVPVLPEQRAIAHILGSLDDKIELNRQMNRTLEQMAQAIFKSWFIDFDPVVYNAVQVGNPVPERFQRTADYYRQNPQAQTLPREILELFPDRFEESEIGEIPVGWGVKPLSELIQLIGGGTPKTKVPEYWNGDIPWFSVVDAPNESDVWVIETEKHITQKGVDNSSTRMLPERTTIISARGTVGKCALVGHPMAMNQSCYGVRPVADYGELFINFMLRNKIEFLQRSGHGSVFNTITRSTFDAIKVADCGGELAGLFDEQVSDSLEKMLENLTESALLTKMRDTLLPRLISGEVRIQEAEKLLEGLNE